MAIFRHEQVQDLAARRVETGDDMWGDATLMPVQHLPVRHLPVQHPVVSTLFLLAVLNAILLLGQL